MTLRAARVSILVVASIASWHCSRSSSSTPPPTPPDTSSALKTAMAASSAAYFTAWENNGALETVPDVYGIDRRRTATAGGQ
jgi:hypothetical protein